MQEREKLINRFSGYEKIISIKQEIMKEKEIDDLEFFFHHLALLELYEKEIEILSLICGFKE